MFLGGLANVIGGDGIIGTEVDSQKKAAKTGGGAIWGHGLTQGQKGQIKSPRVCRSKKN